MEVLGPIISLRFMKFFLFMMSVWLLSSSSPSSQAEANNFLVGGKDGWELKPSEDYNHWAANHRFKVNDTLEFKFNKWADSVLWVTKEDYDACNVKNPMHKMDGGDSIFNLSNSGLYFFISGNVDNCKNGEKLIILVLSVRHKLVAPSSPQGSLPSREVHPYALVPTAQAPNWEAHNSGTAARRVGVGFVVGVIIMYFSFGAIGLV